MDNCGLCMKPADQLFETSKEGVFACFKCQPLVPEVSLGQDDSSDGQQKPTDKKDVSCPFCHKVIPTTKQLQLHIRNHAAEKRFVCTYCTKAFTQSNNLRAHLRIHTNERPYKCHVCDKAFTQVTNLNNHVRLHTGERPFVCGEPGCDKAYAQVSTLNQHRKRHAAEAQAQGWVPCTVCQRQFDSAHRMAQHRAKVHFKQSTGAAAAAGAAAAEAAFECGECGARFRSQPRLLRHVATHQAAQDDKPAAIKCVFSMCGALLSSPREHTEHLLRAHQLRVRAAEAPSAAGKGEPPARGRPRGRPRRQPPPDRQAMEHDPLAPENGFTYEYQAESLKESSLIPKLKVQALFH